MTEPKATVVSIVPFIVHAEKPTIHPGDFVIPASDTKTPSVLVVGSSGHDVYMGVERTPKYLRIMTPSYEIARAIVEDFIHSMIATTAIALPGIFWIPGEFTAKDIDLKFPNEMVTAQANQHRWFIELVKMADDDWVKSNHRHSAISNLQRDACNFLKWEREWVSSVREHPELLNLISCPACTSMISKAAIKCAACGAILDQEKYKKFALVGA
jgi:hypothetical protein